ncbi:alpha/beta fold hydrolase [Pseudocnuella soli]|uniref:alpha/beta fold hydrolase n=1 Tax=Pseudocnuella soli TaxID=2502779 RepID=UPI001042A90E|nr:alpha/beta hydrolase [Pseudocnuella soli]
MKSNYVVANNIRLHYLDYQGDGPTLILMHGLTSNAFCFEGLVAQGLTKGLRIISVDLRGRGLSDAPEHGYTMADHAADIIELMDALDISRAHVGGHSFGAWVSFYIAAHYPDRVEKLVLIDAAAQMHPDIMDMLRPVMTRLGKTYTSFDTYLKGATKAPFLTFWDPAMMAYYQADVAENSDGSVTQRSQPAHMTEAITQVLEEPWTDIISDIPHPALLFNAPDPYTLEAPLLPVPQALATVQLMQNCTYHEIRGNHLTMLYGEGARQIVKATQEFI